MESAQNENVIFAVEENKPVQYLTIWDFILTPIYLLVLTAIAKRMRDKRYPNGHPLRPYYLKGLYLKFFGAIFIALIYQFYYGSGDTFNFFYHAKVINSALDESFSTWVSLLFRTSIENDPSVYPYAIQMFWYQDPEAYFICVITAILGLVNGTTYIPIALMFAFFSFSGIWAMFRTFYNIYPTLHKQLAIAFLFIPSTFVWGSAIFKDTACMFGLGWMVYTTFRLFVNRDLSIKNVLFLILSFYLIASIKLYILLAFLPALSLWLLLNYSHKIKSAGGRWIVNILFIGVTILGFFFFTARFAQELGKYSLDKVATTASITRGWIGQVSVEQDGSAYDLGEFDPSLLGMLSKFPQAVVVTLFRPFPWEVRKVIVALSALESLILLYFTIKVFLGTRGRAFKQMFKDPTVMFCLVFTLIFAFAVGISSYNFGALSRYKIPCMPFYAAFLMILMQKEKLMAPPTKTKKAIKPQWAM